MDLIFIINVLPVPSELQQCDAVVLSAVARSCIIFLSNDFCFQYGGLLLVCKARKSKMHFLHLCIAFGASSSPWQHISLKEMWRLGRKGMS